MKIDSVSFVAHSGKGQAAELEAQLRAALAERGVEVDEGSPDLVVSLGGDGTTLRAAQTAHAADVPLLGINLGTLGYLTEVDAPDSWAALEKIASGDMEIEERLMLACSTGEQTFVGLNEVLVERASRHRLIRLQVRIAGEELAAFNADGLIVATPTGSTAYALSAGGPIVSPRAECMVLVPVAAHMIFSRPFVLPPEDVVELIVDDAEGEAALSIDGSMGMDLPAGTVVRVARHPRPLRLVRLSGPGFVERLRRKLQLPG
jgi:NAD+ kinase